MRRRVRARASSTTSARRVLDVLTDSRLLTVSEGEVEVAHEALLREWPRLRGWLEEDAEGRRLHRQLACRGARLGRRRPRPRRALPRRAPGRGARLGGRPRARAQRARARLPRRERGARAGAPQRRLRMVLAGVAALLVLAVIAGAVALDQRGNARARGATADAQRLGAQALTEDDLDRSLLLARQGVALDDSLQTRGNLLAALLQAARPRSAWCAATATRSSTSPSAPTAGRSPSSRTTARCASSTRGRGGRRAAGRPAGHQAAPSPRSALRPAALQPRRVADRGRRLQRRSILDAATHRVIAHLQVGTRTELVYGLRFSPDGRTLYAVVGSPPAAHSASSASTGARAAGSARAARRPRRASRR